MLEIKRRDLVIPFLFTFFLFVMFYYYQSDSIIKSNLIGNETTKPIVLLDNDHQPQDTEYANSKNLIRFYCGTVHLGSKQPPWEEWYLKVGSIPVIVNSSVFILIHRHIIRSSYNLLSKNTQLYNIFLLIKAVFIISPKIAQFLSIVYNQ